MSLIDWTILLLALGAVMLVAELFLPSHGLLGVMGGGAVLASVATCFLVNRWAGLGLLVVLLVLAPLVGAWMVRIWPRTPVGRRILLPPVVRQVEPLAVQIGQTGVTISELRPMGQCEFSGQRVETLSEFGMIAPGTPVVVVGLNNRRPVVRAQATAS